MNKSKSLYWCEWCERDHEMLAPGDVKAIYSEVAKSGRFPHGVADVRHIEHAIGCDIPSTAEFHRLVNDYLIKQSGTKLTDGQRLQRKRTRDGLTQSQLGRVLGVGKMAVRHYESGRTPLPKSALAWVNGENAPLGEK